MATLTPTISVRSASGQPVTGDAGNLTLHVVTDGVSADYAGSITEKDAGEYAVTVTVAGTLQKVVGVSATSGAVVVPAAWENSPKLDSLIPYNTVWVVATPDWEESLGSGTFDDPYNNLQAAHDDANIRNNMGDMIRVIPLAGQDNGYMVRDNVSIQKDGIRFVGPGDGSFIYQAINGRSWVFQLDVLVHSGEEWSVEGFHFDGTYSGTGGAVGYYSDGVQVRNCYFTNFSSAPLDAGANSVTEDCTFYLCSTNLTTGGGPIWPYYANGVIRRCRFVQCGARSGRGLITMAGTGATVCSGWSVLDNTFINSLGTGLDVVVLAGATDNIIANNILSSDSTITDAGTRTRLHNNKPWAVESGGALATVDTVVDAIKVVSDKLATMLVASGENWQYTAAALALGSTSIDPQDVRDAMMLAPSAGSAASGSIDDQLADIAASIAGIGGGTGAFTVTIPVTDDASDPLDDIAVTMQGSPVSNTRRTDTDGEVVFYRDADTWDIVVADQSGYVGGEWVATVGPTGVLTLVDGEGATVSAIVLEQISLTPPTDPSVCRVYGWIKDHAGAAIDGAAVEYRIENPPATTGDGVTISGADRWQAVATDANGQFEVDLVRSTLIGDKLWRIRSKQDGYNEAVYVPDSATARRSDLTSDIPEV